MDTNLFAGIIQFLSVIVALTSVIILVKTIKNNEHLNKNNLLNELIRQERELRIKLSEYREEIRIRLSKKKEFKEITLDYNTLLFNYYEYVSICIYKKLINEEDAKLYFKEMLPDVRQLFEDSIMFEEGYAQKEQYKGIQWLFKKWEIEY